MKKIVKTRGQPCRAGWQRETVTMLGCRSRVGGRHFNLGRHSHIRAVTLTSGKEALMVTNELGDVRFYTNLFSDNPSLLPALLLGRPGPEDTYPIGYSGHPTPQPRYAAVWPNNTAGGWDLVLGTLTGPAQLMHYPAVGNPGRDLLFHWPQSLNPLHGIPEFVDLNRNGHVSLLLGQANGTLMVVPCSPTTPSQLDFARQTPLSPAQHARHDSGTDGHLTTGITTRFQYPGPAQPSAVDWQCCGGCDLLIGTGDGHVLLLRDLGTKEKVTFDRGQRLAGDDGLIRVEGPACPTVLETGNGRHLLVLDGNGELWSWPVERRESYVTEDLTTACEIDEKTGGWTLHSINGRAILGAGRIVTRHDKKPHLSFAPAAPTLEITPPTDGLCEIHITLHAPPDHTVRTVLRANLTGDPFPDVLVPGESLQAPDQDILVRTADCTGRKLCLSQMTGDGSYSGGLPVFISAIRFIPITPVRGKSPAPLPAVLAGISDTADWFRQFRLDSPRDMEEFISLQAACGFERLYYKLGGACWEYPSRVPEAESVIPDLPDYPRPLTDEKRENCKRLVAITDRVNRVSMAVDAGHRIGMAIFGQLRVQNQGEHILHGFPVDRFFRDHPEFREKDVWGNVRWNHCLAWSEVVDFHARIVEEAMSFGLDGILVDTVRTLPKVLYGEPVLAEFNERHGLDMRSLPPFDQRVVALQCEVMTRFMRAIRDAVHRVNPRGEVHLRVCRPYPLMGVDPVALAQAGLVDEVLIEDRSDTPGDPDIRGLVAALAGTGCRSGAAFCRMNRWGTEVMPLDPMLVERKSREYVAAGASSVTVYESNEAPFYPELRRALLRLKQPATPLRRAF